MGDQDTGVLGAEPARTRRAPRYAVPVTPPIRIAAVALICAAITMVASGAMTWFATNNPGYKTQSFDGFRAARSSAWIQSIPVGWLLLVVAILLCAVALAILRTQRARWLMTAGLGCTLLSAATVLLVIKEKSHVPLTIPRDLRKSVLPLITLHPETKAQVEKQFSGLTVNVRMGLWVALVAALACTAISVFISLKSRRPSDAANA